MRNSDEELKSRTHSLIFFSFLKYVIQNKKMKKSPKSCLWSSREAFALVCTYCSERRKWVLDIIIDNNTSLSTRTRIRQNLAPLRKSFITKELRSRKWEAQGPISQYRLSLSLFFFFFFNEYRHAKLLVPYFCAMKWIDINMYLPASMHWNYFQVIIKKYLWSGWEGGVYLLTGISHLNNSRRSQNENEAHDQLVWVWGPWC